MIDAKNLPTPKIEEWKYTNLSRSLGGLKAIKPQETQEILIHKSCGQDGGELKEILWTGLDGTHHNPRLKVVLEEGAELTLVERHDGVGSYWKNMSSEFIIGANARLNHIRIVEDSEQAVQTNMVNITMEQGSYLNSFSLNIGGKLTRHDIHAALNGANIECNLNGVNLLKGSQHGDTTIVMEHAAPHSSSSQLYRTILNGKARGVFQGKILVQKQAQDTSAEQSSKAIMLSDGCEMDTKPELEIYADNVKCSHGATCGQLDEDPVFYMQSRGISEELAQNLLMQAFIGEVIDNVSRETLQEHIKEKALEWLMI